MDKIKALTLDRESRNGIYADVLDVAQELGRSKYGSACNALAVMVRESPLFQETIRALEARKQQPTAV